MLVPGAINAMLEAMVMNVPALAANPPAGATQTMTRVVNSPSSTQLARFTHGHSAPGTGLRRASRDPRTGAACSAGPELTRRD